MNYIRLCPKCGKKLFYSNKFILKTAIDNHSNCRKCATKKCAKERDLNGSNNPMYGKSIYDVWLQKYGEEEANKKYKILCEKHKIKQSQAVCEKKRLASRGSNNPMFGRSVYSIWLEKYGEEEANRLLLNFKRKQSKKLSGKNNPMYGKPSPQGSGNGWSGWYKGYFFRSILELSYLKYLIDNNIKFKIIDKDSIYKVSYKKDNKNRNYFPDFYLEDTQEIIEVKPYKAIYFKDNQIKIKAAKRKYGDKFKIITDKMIDRLTFIEIKVLYNNNEIKFINKYEKKYKEQYCD